MALLSSSSRQNARLLSRTLLNAGREPEPVGAHRETKRRAASAFAELPRGSGPDDHPASVIANYTLARPGEVASLSYVCRDWARAARLWLDSDLATELWRGVVATLCPATGARHAELGSRKTVVCWLRLPMAVGDKAAWLLREREPRVIRGYFEPTTRFELAHSLGLVFAFLSNVAEHPRSVWRAPRRCGFDQLLFDPHLAGSTLAAGSVRRVCWTLRDAVAFLRATETEAGRLVAAYADRTLRKLLKFLDLQQFPGLFLLCGFAATRESRRWAELEAPGAAATAASRFAALLEEHAPLFPQAADAWPAAPVETTRRLLACPWNDLLAPHGPGDWRFSAARREATGLFWGARAWQADPR